MARILLALASLLVLSCCAAVRPATTTPSDRAFVRAWCAGTEYPALCDATLAPYAGAVRGRPARLAWAALTVTLGGARNATAAMRAMAAAGHLAPVAAEAAKDCVSMLGDAVGGLRQSVEAMARAGGEEAPRRVRFEVDSVRTWASAALTDDEMCMEGFKGEAAGGGGAREAVRGHVMGLVHLTANALGILDRMAKQITSSP